MRVILDEAGHVPPIADDAVASIVKPSPLEKGIEAIEAQDEIKSPKREEDLIKSITTLLGLMSCRPKCKTST